MWQNIFFVDIFILLEAVQFGVPQKIDKNKPKYVYYYHSATGRTADKVGNEAIMTVTHVAATYSRQNLNLNYWRTKIKPPK